MADLISVGTQGMDKAIAGLANVTSNLKKEIGVAAWKTAKHGKSVVAKKVQKELATPQKVIKKEITASRNSGGAAVKFDKTGRIALKFFNPRQTRAGVTYKISKTKGRKVIPGGFMGPKPGAIARKLRGHVWFRSGNKVEVTKGRNKGKMRQRIIKAYGPSPWGVFVVNKHQKPTRHEISGRFGKELQERLRYLTLKQANQLSWQEPQE